MPCIKWIIQIISCWPATTKRTTTTMAVNGINDKNHFLFRHLPAAGQPSDQRATQDGASISVLSSRRATNHEPIEPFYMHHYHVRLPAISSLEFAGKKAAIAPIKWTARCCKRFKRNRNHFHRRFSRLFLAVDRRAQSSNSILIINCRFAGVYFIAQMYK